MFGPASLLIAASLACGTGPQVAEQGDGSDADARDESYAAGFEAGVRSTSSDERFIDHLSAREPLYFVAGTRGRTNARFQLSFQYDFVSPGGSLAREGSVWSGLAFGYTQMSLWDLESDSVPFYDTNYRPSLFWHREAVIGEADGPRWDFEAGYEHESNGQDGADSRSINTLYLRPTYHHPLGNDWEFRTTPKVWAYIGDLSDNPDIEDYRGWFDWRLQLIDPNGLGLSTNLRKGGSSSFGSVQVDVTYPLSNLFGHNLDVYLQLQYFNGWGESLLFYDVKPPAQFRIGIALVR